MKERPKKELGTGRVAFFARKEEIEKELETGRTVMSIYREFGPKMGIGYSQFDRYVNKLIRKKPEEDKEPVRKKAEKENVAEKIKSDPNYVTKSLKYDPDTPKEDLT